MSKNVVEIHSDADWQQLFEMCMQNDNILVCDWTAAWCRPCSNIAPFYQQLADISKTDSETENLFVFAKIDVDECPSAAAQNKVKAMPTFLVFYRGQQIQMLKGANKDALRMMVEQSHLQWRSLQQQEQQVEGIGQDEQLIKVT